MMDDRSELVSYKVRDLPEGMRPREILEKQGVSNVQDDVLLAILLRSGVRGMNVVELARALLTRFGSLTGISSATADEIATVHGMGAVKAQVLTSALELGRRMNVEAQPRRRILKAPADVSAVLKDRVDVLEQEVFWVLLLDARNGLKGEPVEVSTGLLDASLVHAREVFRDAVRNACGSVILAHNHPSGDTTPSAEDIKITKQLVEAGNVIDIKVLDHVILGRRQDGARSFLSLREEGLVSFN
jgi:DNA repair protein RadC